MSAEPKPTANSTRSRAGAVLRMLVVGVVMAILLATIVWPWIGETDGPPKPVPQPPTKSGPWREATWESPDRGAPVVTLAQLQHNDETLSARLRRFDAKARELAGPTWYHVPYTQRGNYVKAGWSTHTRDQGRIGWVWQRPPAGDAQFISVGTLCYPQSPRAVFGIELEAEYVPAGNGWAARVSYHDDAGARIYDLAASVIFYRRGQDYDDGIIVTLPPDNIPTTLATPESLRDFAIARIEEQREKFEEALASDKLRHTEHDMKQYGGGGIPPPKISRLYTAAEKQKLISERRTKNEAKIKALRDDCPQMHEALARAFPLQECW
jgi:hypothetical protein